MVKENPEISWICGFMFGLLVLLFFCLILKLVCLSVWFFDFIFRLLGLINHLQSKNVFFGRIRAVVPNLSSAGFGRPSPI